MLEGRSPYGGIVERNAGVRAVSPLDATSSHSIGTVINSLGQRDELGRVGGITDNSTQSKSIIPERTREKLVVYRRSQNRAKVPTSAYAVSFPSQRPCVIRTVTLAAHARHKQAGASKHRLLSASLNVTTLVHFRDAMERNDGTAGRARCCASTTTKKLHSLERGVHSLLQRSSPQRSLIGRQFDGISGGLNQKVHRRPTATPSNSSAGSGWAAGATTQSRCCHHFVGN